MAIISALTGPYAELSPATVVRVGDSGTASEATDPADVTDAATAPSWRTAPSRHPTALDA